MAFSSADDDIVSDINITPLVDVMLVLLVAFIVTVPVLTQSIKVDLPKTEASASSAPTKRVTVSIDSTGALFLDRQPLGSEQAVVEALRQARQASSDALVVQVQADEKVAYAPVARILGALEKAGFTKLSLLTAPE
jgi:biopolymer transport protein ExbD